MKLPVTPENQGVVPWCREAWTRPVVVRQPRVMGRVLSQDSMHKTEVITAKRRCCRHRDLDDT